MNRFLDNAAGALARVWKKQMDVPLPEYFRDKEQYGSKWECAAFPLTGWLCGAALTIPAVFAAWLFNDFAGAFVYALAGWLFFTFRDSGRSDAMIAEIAAGKMPAGQIQWRMVIPILLQAVKFALLILIFLCGNAWHLAVIIGGIFFMEAVLTVDGGFSPPLLDDSESSRRNMWATVLVLLLISFIINRFGALTAAAAVAVLWKIFQTRNGHTYTNMQEISLAGGITGWVLLLTGILTL